MDETVHYDGQSYPLFTNRWADEPKADDPWVAPKGFRHLERFYLEGATPVWTFACAEPRRLEKRLWMQQDANTTYVQYTFVRGSQPLTLHLQALVDVRDHHGNVASEGCFPMQIEASVNGLRLTAFDRRPPSTC